MPAAVSMIPPDQPCFRMSHLGPQLREACLELVGCDVFALLDSLLHDLRNSRGVVGLQHQVLRSFSFQTLLPSFVLSRW